MKTAEPMIEMRGVTKHFLVSRGYFGGKRVVVHALDDVDLAIYQGEILGLVGETGSGKSTLARTMLRLLPIDGGTIRFGGTDITTLRGRALRNQRRDMQIVFQDAASAFDPRMRLGESIAVPLGQHQIGVEANRSVRVGELLEEVGLDASYAQRYPDECSGGQLSRAGIARALALRPRFLACDEATSSLDASVRAQVLNLLVDLKDRLNLTLLMIAHDLRVVRYICDRVAVMYLGQIVEIGPRDEIFQRPRHPYTRKLIQASFPEGVNGDWAESILEGEPPSPINPPAGCRFRSRCPLATAICYEKPRLDTVGPDHRTACWHSDQAVPLMRFGLGHNGSRPDR